MKYQPMSSASILHKVPRFNFQGKGKQADLVGKNLKEKKEEWHLKEKTILLLNRYSFMYITR